MAIDALERMQNASQRMSELIQGLLQYSRVSTVEAECGAVDLNDVIQNVLSDLEVSMNETGGIVNVEDMPAVKADPLQMRQLFQNLIGNALKFHKPGESPVINITARILPADILTGGGRCEIVVRDNGIGFPEKDNERIFGVFQKLHNPSEYAGTGIGLSICRKIAERNNGHLTATSNSDGGAEFKIILPL